ncbi:septum formation family protein [Microbacterium album]|uniref:Septum formation-related domain-containing protein n=1 Tax=Microbacterium album TaxID=2053191 RepID=A0A917MMF8_9MICO|nr:septum formation family protein [Microbacterium album]GGH48276.1 hypothetical protein GCM10010921_25610 [Microbacterium album]
MTTAPTARRIAAAGASLALIGALGGCAGIGGLLSGSGQPQRDDDTGEITQPGDVDVFSLEVGDCLNLSDETEVFSAAVVPCSDPHTGEIYHAFDLAGDEWPGDAAVSTAADAGCYQAFEEFTGVAYGEEDSLLAYDFFAPVEDGWNDPDLRDRLIQCVVYKRDGRGGVAEVTGSLEGAAR